MSKKNISQLDLRLDIETDHFEYFNIFYSQDLLKIDNIKIPNIIKFYRADKFDTKFINSNNDVWEYYYSGSRVYLNFSKFNKYQKKLAKYLFAIYIQYNSPSNLSGKLTAYRYLINELVSKEEKLNFKNIKNILEGIVDKYQQYYFIKFMAKQLFLENFYKFNEDQEYDLEFIKRPSSFNSNLYYQE